MIRRFLPLLLVAAATAQAADPAARYISRQNARTAPARQVATTPAAAETIATTTTTTAVRETPREVRVTQRVEEIDTVIIPAHEPRLLETANVLPLALDDQFEFRKQKITFYDHSRRSQIPNDAMARFERDRITYGALSNEERDAREGFYFVFWWRNQRPAELTVRLEYRQANLGNMVQAREVDFNAPKGTHEVKFSIIGDDFHDDGAVTAWRVVLIENNKIVATRQSFLWH